MSFFETEICSRCGGTGEYSYCESHGTKCFKCRGKKVALTKRGATAMQYLEHLQTKEAKDAKVGDTIKVNDLHYSYKASIVEIRDEVQEGSSLKDGVMVPYSMPVKVIVTNHSKFGRSSLQCPLDYKVRTYPTSDDNKSKALEYQSNLTKAGKPRKLRKT